MVAIDLAEFSGCAGWMNAGGNYGLCFAPEWSAGCPLLPTHMPCPAFHGLRCSVFSASSLIYFMHRHPNAIMDKLCDAQHHLQQDTIRDEQPQQDVHKLGQPQRCVSAAHPCLGSSLIMHFRG